MADDLNLDASIRDAVAKNPPVEEKPVENKDEKVDEKKDEKKDEVVEEKTVEIEADEQEVKNALTFFRALADPEQRGKLLETLAVNSGYDLSKKKEVTQLVRDTKAILKEKLGDSYDLLSGDALAAAFEESVTLKVQEITKPVLDRISNAEKQANETKANNAMDSFFKRNEITAGDREKVSDALLQKMKVMPATPSTNVDEYLDDLYIIISKKSGDAKVVKDTIKKIAENARERNSSGEGTGNDERVRKGSQMPSLDEAVRAAYRGEKLEP